MTQLNKKVIDGVAPVTLAECVMMGDGTNLTIKDKINSLELSGGTNKYEGKKVLWLGDSISVASSPSYPAYVCNALNMTLTNKASSGGDAVRMRMILQGGTDSTETYPTIDVSDFDYVFIMIGHNCDGTYGVTSSTASINNIPTDDTPYSDYVSGFYTDVASCIEYIWDNNQDCQIYLITPIQSTNGRYAPTTVAAQKALKEIGNFYSIPVIDVYGECGICKKNITVYTDDNIHPNTTGVPKIGDYIINYLLNH